MGSWQSGGDDYGYLGPPRVSLGAFWRVLAVAAALGLVIGALSLGQGREAGYAASSGSGLFVFGTRDGIALNSPYSDGTNPLINWSDLEPQDGVYNWSALDSAIAAAKSAGKRIVPRIETNIDGGGAATPSWFFALPGVQYYYPSSGAQSHGYKSPVPWDPTFQQQFGAFLTAMGQRYNGNSTIAFIQTNAGGGMYGEQYMGNTAPGYSASVQIAATKTWLDRWQAAFPNTHLAVMVNYLGGNIGEDVSAYAAGKGIYLQQNSPSLSSGSVALFTANENKTSVVLEIEDGGCQGATGSSFASTISKIESYGFPIDYLMICSQTLGDAGTASTLPSVSASLRGASAAAPAATGTPIAPTASATATATSAPGATATSTSTPSAGAQAGAVMLSPAPGSKLTSSRATFMWSSVYGGRYAIAVGTTPGAANLYSRSMSTLRSATVYGLPTNGSTFYVRLSTTVGGSTSFTDYVYQAYGVSRTQGSGTSTPTPRATSTSVSGTPLPTRTPLPTNTPPPTSTPSSSRTRSGWGGWF